MSAEDTRFAASTAALRLLIDFNLSACAVLHRLHARDRSRSAQARGPRSIEAGHHAMKTAPPFLMYNPKEELI